MKKSLKDIQSDLDSLSTAIEEHGDECYTEGVEEGFEKSEETFENRLNSLKYEFALEKLKEVFNGTTSLNDSIREMESEVCRHMPLIGKTFFDK